MAGMRGDDRQPDAMFSYVSAEQRVPADHPLRAIRALVDDVLRDMSLEFDGLYARAGRPSIPPERLLRAQLLQIFYSIRSEALLMEQLEYNLLFRWFVGLTMDDPVGDATVFTKNRDRLLNAEIARASSSTCLSGDVIFDTPNRQTPYAHQATVGYVRELAASLALHADLIY